MVMALIPHYNAYVVSIWHGSNEMSELIRTIAACTSYHAAEVLANELRKREEKAGFDNMSFYAVLATKASAAERKALAIYRGKI